MAKLVAPVDLSKNSPALLGGAIRVSSAAASAEDLVLSLEKTLS